MMLAQFKNYFHHFDLWSLIGSHCLKSRASFWALRLTGCPAVLDVLILSVLMLSGPPLRGLVLML